MTNSFVKSAIMALASAAFIATPVVAANAMGCGCCGGQKSAGKNKSGASCMGGGDAAGGMSCMKGMDMANMSTAQKASDDAMMSGMGQSKMDLSGMNMSSDPVAERNADVAFAKALIPHHEAAVAMAKQLLKNGKNDDMKAMANEIIAAQNREIKTLYGWLAKNAE